MPIIEGCGSHGGHFQRNRLEHPAGKAAWRFMPKMVIAVPPGRRCGYARAEEAAVVRRRPRDVEPLGRGFHPREVRERPLSPRRPAPPHGETGWRSPGDRWGPVIERTLRPLRRAIRAAS